MSKSDYNNASPLALKFIKSDGTIVDALPVSGGVGGGTTSQLLDTLPRIKTLTNVTNLNMGTLVTTGKKVVSFSIESLNDASTLKFGADNTETIANGKVLNFGSGNYCNISAIVASGSFFVCWEEVL